MNHFGLVTSLSRVCVQVTSIYSIIERKNHDAYQTKSCLYVLLATNNDWAVPASADARRFACIKVSPARKGQSEYWAALRYECKQHPGAFLHFLKTHDYFAESSSSDNITRFNPTILPSVCAGQLFENKLHTMSPVHKWWYNLVTNDEAEILSLLGNARDKMLIKEELFNHYNNNQAKKPLCNNELFKQLKVLLP